MNAVFVGVGVHIGRWRVAGEARHANPGRMDGANLPRWSIHGARFVKACDEGPPEVDLKMCTCVAACPTTHGAVRQQGTVAGNVDHISQHAAGGARPDHATRVAVRAHPGSIVSRDAVVHTRGTGRTPTGHGPVLKQGAGVGVIELRQVRGVHLSTKVNEGQILPHFVLGIEVLPIEESKVGVPTLHQAFVGTDARSVDVVELIGNELNDVPRLPVQFKRIRLDVERVVEPLNRRVRSGGWRGRQPTAVAERPLGVGTPAVHPLVVGGVAQQGARPLIEVADLDLDRHPTGGQADAHRRGRGRDGVAAVAQTTDGFVAPASEAAVEDRASGGLAHGEGGGAVGIVFVLQIDAVVRVGHEVAVFADQAHAVQRNGTGLSPTAIWPHVRGADQSHGIVIGLSIPLHQRRVVQVGRGGVRMRTTDFRHLEVVFRE